jgi:hypothetical protein
VAANANSAAMSIVRMLVLLVCFATEKDLPCPIYNKTASYFNLRHYGISINI